jgi:hypothetical protein
VKDFGVTFARRESVLVQLAGNRHALANTISEKACRCRNPEPDLQSRRASRCRDDQVVAVDEPDQGPVSRSYLDCAVCDFLGQRKGIASSRRNFALNAEKGRSEITR